MGASKVLNFLGLLHDGPVVALPNGSKGGHFHLDTSEEPAESVEKEVTDLRQGEKVLNVDVVKWEVAAKRVDDLLPHLHPTDSSSPLLI
jgi:hypothetical protein